MQTPLEDLFEFNAWGNRRVLALSSGLSDEQLDHRRDLGTGSLRNTIFHILLAEEVWLERWQGLPRRPFPYESEGIPLAELSARLEQVHQSRGEYCRRIREDSDGLLKVCHYHDSSGTPHANRLDELMLHVVNHGIHHRAQALHYLKHCGQTTPGGLDYVFFTLARPSLRQSPPIAALLQGYGLEIGTADRAPLLWDSRFVSRYFDYSHWAYQRLRPLLEGLSAEQLDADFDMGLGSIRKTLLHLVTAEQFWWKNWTDGSAVWTPLPETTSLAEAYELLESLRRDRADFIAGLDQASAIRPVGASFGGPPVMVPIVESMLQLCGHATHHRAQLLNMLRRTAVSPPAIDYVVFAREHNLVASPA